MNATTLLLVTVLTLPTNVLVLRSGQRIQVESARQENGRIVFQTLDGRLFSLAIEEIDVNAMDATPAGPQVITPDTAGAERPLSLLKLKGTDEERKRLLEALEQNHAGVAVPLGPIVLPPAPPSLERQTEDEWAWRNRAKSLEELVRQAKENRDLLVSRAESLRARILSLLSLGFKPSQFGYDTTLLQLTIEQIPEANLEVERAERALAQFREEARQRGILPGWVR